MKVLRHLLARDTEPVLAALAHAAGGCVLVGGNGETIAEAGESALASLGVPFAAGDRQATLLVPPEARGIGEIVAAAFQQIAIMRATTDDLAGTTRRLWLEQNLLFSVSEIIRYGYKEGATIEWLLHRLRSVEPATVTIARWEGHMLVVVAGNLPPPLRIGTRLEPSRLAAEVLDTGQAIAFCPNQDEPREVALGVPVEPGVPCLLTPMRSAHRLFGVLTVLRAPGERAFSAEEVKLVQLLADFASLALTNGLLVQEAEQAARLVREIELAAQIQRSILSPEHAAYGALDLAVTCQPVLQVGGDGYLHRILPDGHVFAAILDVAGNGLGVALVLSALGARLDALADVLTSPAGLLVTVNTQLTRGDFNCYALATATLVRLDPASGEFTLAVAGHPPALVRRATGTFEMLDRRGPNLGISSGETVPETQGRLGPGDLLVLLTDGILDALGPAAEPFGWDGVRAALAAPSATATAARTAILAAVAAFTGQQPAVDDRTVLVIRRQGDRNV